ncbi:unnamed protein product [Gongylonema pulchrum]|uniref:Trafficking protein particle complex subunit 6B n=1 Tax=Gongylonema pulchrum TaxID=637853 RepID=A0A183EM16_9BILA|nr:unnamed protein product [Gongylonema pulchrum]
MSGSLLSSVPNFPFEFLHAEMICYQKERQAKLDEKRKDWFQEMRSYPQVDEAALSDQLQLRRQGTLLSAYVLQGNAETRLEALGYRVGFVLTEKVAKDLPRLNSELERMKFLCKEFWTAAFGKQVDNLRTNHQVASHRFCLFKISRKFADSTNFYEEEC